MKNIHFETDTVTVRAVPLRELSEHYLTKNPPKGVSDRNNIKKAFDLLTQMFPEATTATFTANQLLIFRNNLVDRISEKTGKTYSIDYCNKLVKFVRTAFTWGMTPNLKVKSESDLIPPLVSELLCFSLSQVPSLKEGDGRKNTKRTDVPQEFIEAVLRCVRPFIADMLRLQLLTGMRPGEVCQMRVDGIKKTEADFGEYHRLFDSKNWIYVLHHKTEKYIGMKAIPLGFEAQDILEKYLPTAETFIFTKRSKRGFGKPFTVNEYDRYISRAIRENQLAKIVPYELRHTNLSRISDEFNRDTARAVAGHTTEEMTARYDHSDIKKAFKVANARNAQYEQKKAGDFRESPETTSRFSAIFQNFPRLSDNN